MNNLINLLNIEKLPIEDKKLLIDEASDLVEVRVLTRILKSIDNDKRKTLANFLVEENKDGVSSFFKDNNIDIISIMEEEIENLKKELEKESLVE